MPAVYDVNNSEQETSAASQASAHVSTALTGYADGVGAAVVTLLSRVRAVKGKSVDFAKVNVLVKPSKAAVTVVASRRKGRPVASVRVKSEDRSRVPVGEVKVKTAVVLAPVKVKVDTSSRSCRMAASCRRAISVGSFREIDVFVGSGAWGLGRDSFAETGS